MTLEFTLVDLAGVRVDFSRRELQLLRREGYGNDYLLLRAWNLGWHAR